MHKVIETNNYFPRDGRVVYSSKYRLFCHLWIIWRTFRMEIGPLGMFKYKIQ